MGDRNYFPNQYSPFVAQPYSYNEPQRQSLSGFFDLRSPESRGFSDNASTPAYNSGPSYNRAQYSGVQRAQSRETFHNDRPPPSYQDSHNDKLLSKSDTRYSSSAWSFINERGGEEQYSQNRSFSNLFDLPGQAESHKKTSEWSRDRFNPSQNYQRNPQGKLNPHNNFSQQPSTTFSSDYKDRSDFRYSQNSFPSGRQTSDFRQNNKREFAKQNQKSGRGKGGFRGRGNRGNRGRSNDSAGGRRQGESGGKKNSNNSKEGVKSAPQDHVKNMEDKFLGLNKLGSEDEGNREDEDEGNREDEDEGNREDEDEGNREDENEDGEDQKEPIKVNVFVPDSSTVKKYEFYPPSAEEMGEMFKDMVIYFFFKIPKNCQEKNPFVVICESFRRSSGYSHLEVEDGYDVTCKNRKFCTLRYHGMMMVRGAGENNNLKEPRVLAGVELIDKLAMSCYTLEAKPEYFSVKGFEKLREQGGVPGVCCFPPEEETYECALASNYIESAMSNEDSDVEYIIHLKDNTEANRLKRWAKTHQPPWDARVIKDQWIGICRHRTPQYWRDKIRASGSMETPKFLLKPPQGIGNRLMKDFNTRDVVVHLKNRPYRECTIEIYGPPGVGPKISTALPPWERRGGGRRNKNSGKKQRKTIRELNEGVPLTQIKTYHRMSKNMKKRFRKKFGERN